MVSKENSAAHLASRAVQETIRSMREELEELVQCSKDVEMGGNSVT